MTSPIANAGARHPAVRASGDAPAKHAGRGPSGPEGVGSAGHPAEDASAARRAQLGEAQL